MESELGRVVDALPGFVWTALPDGQIELINQSWSAYTGLELDASCGWGWQSAIHPEDLPQLLASWGGVPASRAPVEAEARLRGADGNYRWFSFRAQPVADASGQVVKWCGLSTDIHDRIQVEETRRASERRFRLIVDELPVLLSTATPDGGLEQANRHYLEYFGATLEELKAREAPHGLHPDDQERVRSVRRAAIEAGRPYEIECRRRRADGVYRWFYLRAFPLRDAEGRIALWYRLQTDIDDQKRAEALLAGEKQLLEMVASGCPMPDILEALCRLVEDTTSGCYCSVVLVDPSGSKLQEAIAPSLAPEFNEAVRSWPLDRIGGPCVMAARDKVQVIMSDVASDARWRNSWRKLAQAHGLRSCWSTPIVSLAGDVLGTFALYQREPGSPSPPQLELIAHFTHIASIAIERAQRDAALRQSESRLAEAERELQLMIDNIPAFVTVFRSDGERAYVNKTWRDNTGLQLADIQDGGWRRIVHPDDQERSERLWRAAIATGEPLEIEQRIRRHDGLYRWHMGRRVPLRDDAGNILRWYSVAIDIEDQKRAEEARRQSEARLAEAERELQLTIDSIPTLVATYRPDGVRIFVNQTWRDYSGLTLDSAMNVDRLGASIVHPDDAGRFTQEWQMALAARTPLKIEVRLRRADGEYRWHAMHRVPARDEAGAIVKWYSVAIDIEVRKRAEDAARQSEARLAEAERELQRTIDTIPAKVATYEPDGTRSFVNQQWRNYVEATGDARNIVRHFHPDDSKRAERAWRNALATGEPLSVDMRIKRADGEYRWHTHHCVPLCDEQGTILKWYAAEVDIEDKKRAENALLRSEARLAAAERELRLTLDSIPTITWRAGPNGYVQQLNKRWFEYTGTTPEQVRGARWKSCVHPDDLERLVDIGRAYVAFETPIDGEARVRRFDGTYRWFLFRPAPARDDAGKLIGWYGIITDIEDQKRAEEALRASEVNLKVTIDTIPAVAWSARLDGSAEFFNKNYLDYVGLSLEQAQDWGWTGAVHPDDLTGLAGTWQTILASGKQGEAEARLRRHDGEYRWFLFRASPLRDEAGNIVKWFGVNTEIEERKQAEEELRRSEAFLAEGQRLSLTGTFSWRVDADEVTFSQELHRIFEFDQDAVVTLRRLRERTHPEDRALMDESVSDVRAGRNISEIDVRLRMPDERVKYLRILGRLIRRQDGRLEFLGAIQDVTQGRLAEAVLDKVRSELAHVTRVMSFGALTASIAHEVNQPLAGIVTNASTCLRMLAADPPNVEGARETARRTIRDGNRAADVIARLRALFSKKAAATETVDLNEATREVLTLVFGDLLRNRVVLRVELDNDHPLLVAGDRVQLQQVILNLVRNASDAMSEVNDRPRDLIVKAYSEEAGGARLIIKDAGVGFEPQGAERLFDAFYTTKNGGMGIGLSLSRSIIENHGGNLWAETNDGPGATFSFSIPRQATSAGDEGTAGAILTRPTRGAHDLMRNTE
jgi:PAS domain S-box-containing protein